MAGGGREVRGTDVMCGKRTVHQEEQVDGKNDRRSQRAAARGRTGGGEQNGGYKETRRVGFVVGIKYTARWVFDGSSEI